MFNTSIIKKNTSIFKTDPIDYLLVNWHVLNNEGCLENFEYNKENNTIIFNTIIKQDIWCFILHLPINNNNFFLSSSNSDPSTEQINLINKMNNKFINYDYSEFSQFILSKSIINYNLQKSILIKTLNEINDECADFTNEEDTDEEDDKNNCDLFEFDGEDNDDKIKNTFNSIDESFLEINLDEMSNLFSTKNNDNETLDEDDEDNEDEIIDIWAESDDFKIDSIQDNKPKVYFNKMEVLEVSKEFINSKIDNSFDTSKMIINFTDINRIQMLLKEVDYINSSINENIRVLPIDNNIFNLVVTMQGFNDHIINENIKMFIKLDSNLYPYLPPKISFNVLFEDNLSYLISDLDYFKIQQWNPTNTLDYTISSIWSILNLNATINSSTPDINEFTQLLNDISVYSQIKPLNINSKNINIKFNNFNIDSNKLDKRNGVGYGNEHRSNFDIKQYINSIDVKNNMIMSTLIKIIDKLGNDIYLNLIQQSCLLPLISYYMKDIQLLEMSKAESLYHEIFQLVDKLITSYSSLLQYNFNDNNLLIILKSCKVVIDTYNIINPQLSNIELELKNLLDISLNTNILDNINITFVDLSINDQYLEFIKKNSFELINNFDQGIYTPLDKKINEYCKNIPRIAKEMTSLRINIPSSWGSSMFIKFNKENIAMIKVAIIGPNNTPYENGFYEFHIKLGSNYPIENPSCHFQTTNGGKVRFNPNLYDSGKVCLSLLGTWQGHESEQWNNNTSSILQLLLSIQSLILCESPYFNEPGYEREYGTINGKASSNKYNHKIQKYCIEVAIIKQINNPPINFENNVYGHFYFKRKEIETTFDNWSKENIELIKYKDELYLALDKAQNKYLDTITN